MNSLVCSNTFTHFTFKKIFTTASLLLLTVVALAQNGSISGTVPHQTATPPKL